MVEIEIVAPEIQAIKKDCVYCQRPNEFRFYPEQNGYNKNLEIKYHKNQTDIYRRIFKRLQEQTDMLVGANVVPSFWQNILKEARNIK